ncbi:MAG: uroporphyrinogen decarboxylase family protein [Bacteroidales bacterium]|nr:uroporphyrinogen decarboxylase family protein [Bacteroidales bacterium]
MSMKTMTSMERVLTTLGHQEPDRVPLFLLLTMHGAKELGLTIKEYFSNAGNVAEGQLRLRKKYSNDCIYAFFHAPIETEAWGGEVIFHEEGPPNAGAPFITRIEQIHSLKVPSVKESKGLQRVCEAISKIKSRIGDEAPIIGVAMSPFSLPVMQMGFDKYLDLMFLHPKEFNLLMRLNEQFCIEWSNAQLAAGATAICYFDPVSSPTIIPREKYLETGYLVAKRTISQIQGPTATHFASGRCLGILDDVATTGTAVVGVSALEELRKLKEIAKGRITLLGNLNGVEMRTWSQEKVEKEVRDAIEQAGSGGGFILSDNHGEIPFQVEDDTLLAISEATRRWGEYPPK